MAEQKVIFTGTIPQCPYCKKPTERTGGGGSVTAMYFPPKYNEEGVNINPDRNTITSGYQCLKCNKSYTTSGNEPDGFYYVD